MKTPDPKKEHTKKKIRGFSHSKRNEKDNQKSIEVIRQAIKDIYQQRKSQLSFEECYRNAYYLVRTNLSEKLFDNVKSQVTNCLAEVAGEELMPLIDSNVIQAFKHQLKDPKFNLESSPDIGKEFLTKLIKIWGIHLAALPPISVILKVLDQYLIKLQTKNNTIYESCLELFYTKILSAGDGLVKKYFSYAVLEQIELERNGNRVDQSLIRNSFNMFNMINQLHFKTILETPFLDETKKHYTQLFENRQFKDKSAILLDIKKYMKEEHERNCEQMTMIPFGKVSKILLDSAFLPKLEEICEDQESGILYMLNNDKYNEIKLLYNFIDLCKESHYFDGLKKGIKRFINYQCNMIQDSISDSKNKVQAANSLITMLIQLKNKWDQIHLQGLKSDKQFQETSATSFSEEFTKFKRLPEYLTIYLDEQFNKKHPSASDELDMELTQDNSLKLFRYLKSKDIFETYYRESLTRRLLHVSRPINSPKYIDNMTYELQFSNKLESECGAFFTKKIKSMLRDLEKAAIIHNEFLTNTDPIVQPTLLTSSLWPISIFPDCKIPEILKPGMEKFTNFLNGRDTLSKKITWLFNMGYAEIELKYLTKKHEIITNTIQMLILLMYNQNLAEKEIKFNYQEIQEYTQLPEIELKKNLVTLIHPKQKLLIKNTKGEIQDTDEFTLNCNFTHPRVKFRLVMPSLKLKPEVIKTIEQEEISSEEIRENRNHQIDAAIIRIMKMRRRLKHDKLIEEVIGQLKAIFTPEISVIKARIDNLMSREFLDRKKDELDVYIYVA
ncbi:Cullin-domain-containing protein [Neoconidiobolus thromboides FSU 785]|nr:Cullin-domain-containing protein [Neoconidiobolus thromboides FSU 785]